MSLSSSWNVISARGEPSVERVTPARSWPVAGQPMAMLVALGGFALCGIILLLRSAWMSDDAYITLRTIDNFWHGYGLRWNVMERVQAYTDPLWMLLIGAAYGLTREAYFTTLVVSIICTVATVAIVVTRIARSAAAAVVALALLLGSKAFVEFSTSGLENPLTHLLLALCVWQYWDSPTPQARVWRVSLLASLCALNRLDSLALAGPLLLVSIWTARSARTMGAVIAGFLPLAAWELFALVYYGSLVPNTVYAKLATAVPARELIVQGGYYLRDSLFADPVTLPTIAVAAAWTFWTRDRASRALGVGLAAALFFIVRVGGDFMTGRFLSAPFLVAVLVVCRYLPHRMPGWTVAAISIGVTLCSMSSPQSPWPRPIAGEPIYSRGHGIIDERHFYYPGTGLLQRLAGTPLSAFGLAQHGTRWRGMTPHVEIFEAVGMVGFHAGPSVHIIDPNGLTDALLARLPAKPGWHIGHFVRAIPAGYVETVEHCLALTFPHAAVVPTTTSCVTSPSRVNAIADPKVAALYDRLALITQGPLFDKRRLWAIAEMHFSGD